MLDAPYRLRTLFTVPQLVCLATNDIDDSYLESAGEMLGYKTREKAGHGFKKRIITFALAAALILGLGTIAYAIGLSIHRLRQEELREHLQIDENQVTDYVEYPVAEDPEKDPVDGVTLLSTMNDGEFQRLWVVIN